MGCPTIFEVQQRLLQVDPRADEREVEAEKTQQIRNWLRECLEQADALEAEDESIGAHHAIALQILQDLQTRLRDESIGVAERHELVAQAIEDQRCQTFDDIAKLLEYEGGARKGWNTEVERGHRHLVLGELATVIQSLDQRMHSSHLGSAPRVEELDPLGVTYRLIAEAIVKKLRMHQRSYVGIKDVQGDIDAEIEYLMQSQDMIGEIVDSLLENLPTSGPASLLAMDHQYATLGDEYNAVFAIIAFLQGYNGAHGSLAGIDKLREKTSELLREYFGWQKEKNAFVVGVDSGTRGNELGTRFHLRSARLGPALIRALQQRPPEDFDETEDADDFVPKDIHFVPDIPIPESVHTIIKAMDIPVMPVVENPEEGVPESGKIEYLHQLPAEIAQRLPPKVVSECLDLVYAAIEEQYESGHWPLSEERAQEKRKTSLQQAQSAFASRLHEENAKEDGSNTVVFASELLHYTLQQSITSELNGERVELVQADEQGRGNFAASENKIEEAVAVGHQVVLFAAAGNTSFGALDDYVYLQRLQQRLEDTYGRSFQIHTDAAWGWTVGSMVREPATGRLLEFAEVQDELYFAGENGEERYNNIVAMMAMSDTAICDMHKDSTPYSCGALMMKYGNRLGPITLHEKPPYLDIDPSIGCTEDGLRVNLCSHPLTVSLYAASTMMHLYRNGVMQKRHQRLLAAADTAQERLAVYDGLSIPGREPPARHKVKLVPVCPQNTRIMNFVVVPEDCSDQREVERLTKHVKSCLGGGAKTANKYHGVTVSSTQCPHKTCAPVQDMKNEVDMMSTLRLCMTNPDQLSADAMVDCEAAHPNETVFDFTMRQLQAALDTYDNTPLPPPPPKVNFSPVRVLQRQMRKTGSPFSGISPILRATAFGDQTREYMKEIASYCDIVAGRLYELSYESVPLKDDEILLVLQHEFEDDLDISVGGMFSLVRMTRSVLQETGQMSVLRHLDKYWQPLLERSDELSSEQHLAESEDDRDAILAAIAQLQSLLFLMVPSAYPHVFSGDIN